MSDDKWIGILVGVFTLINGLWALVMRGVKAELSTMRSESNEQRNAMRSEISSELAGVRAKLDLHVIQRLDRCEADILRARRRLHEIANTVQRISLCEQRIEQLEEREKGDDR